MSLPFLFREDRYRPVHVHVVKFWRSRFHLPQVEDTDFVLVNQTKLLKGLPICLDSVKRENNSNTGQGELTGEHEASSGPYGPGPLSTLSFCPQFSCVHCLLRTQYESHFTKFKFYLVVFSLSVVTKSLIFITSSEGLSSSKNEF